MGLFLLIVCIGLNWYFESIPFRLWSIDKSSETRLLRIMSFNIDGSETNITDRAERIVEIINRLVLIPSYCGIKTEHDSGIVMQFFKGQPFGIFERHRFLIVFSGSGSRGLRIICFLSL